jgi:hypothetical protein
MAALADAQVQVKVVLEQLDVPEINFGNIEKVRA